MFQKKGFDGYFYIEQTAMMIFRLFKKDLEVYNFNFLCFFLWIQILRAGSG